MEIKYKATYVAPNKQYTAGEIPLMLGLAMEIADLRPELAEGSLKPGQVLRVLYGITPEEFALKDAAESRAFAELAARLRKEAPADRLIGWRVTDLRGQTVACELKLKTSPSIDDGAFVRRVQERSRVPAPGPIDEILLKCRDLQKLGAAKDAPQGVRDDLKAARAEMGEELSKLENLFIADDALLKGRFPSVGFDGRCEVFTTAARAEAMRKYIEKNNGGVALWQIRQINGSEIDGFFRSCADNGMRFLRVDNGFAAAELSLDDFRKDAGSENSILRGNMTREIEYGVRFERYKADGAAEKVLHGAFESTLTLRNFVWHDIGNALLYALAQTDEGGDALLATPAARAKADPARKLHISNADKTVILNEKTGDKRFLAVFTSEIRAASCAEKISENARPVLMTFDDLRVRAGNLSGFAVDFETLNYRVLKEQFDKIVELRAKPLMIVRVKPKEEAPAEAEPTPAPAVSPADPDAGSLPDPDSFETPSGEAAAQPEKEARQTAVEAPETKPEESGAGTETPKKGFFRRLFGRKDR